VKGVAEERFAGFHDDVADDTDTRIIKLVRHPLPRVLFWLAVILVFEALDIPWRLRKLRARLS
jgi:hypothetical protein